MQNSWRVTPNYVKNKSGKEIERGISSYDYIKENERIKNIRLNIAKNIDEAIEMNEEYNNQQIKELIILEMYPFMKEFIIDNNIKDIKLDNPDTLNYKISERGIVRNFGNNDYYGVIYFIVDGDGTIKEIPYKESLIDLNNSQYGEPTKPFDVSGKDDQVKAHIDSNSKFIITYNISSIIEHRSVSISEL